MKRVGRLWARRAPSWLAVLVVWAALSVHVGLAHADPTLVHVVRQGETLASIAELYYGDPRRESVLVAENGLASEGGSSIVVGLRLVIPTVGYHRAVDGETWSELATRYYGDPHRAFALIEANGNKAGEHPDIGAELLVPYPLRVVASQNDPLRKIAKAYYDSMAAMNTIRRFNTNYKNRIVRGQILLAPLADLVLSAQGKKLAEAQVGSPQLGGDTRKKQTEIDAELPALRDHVRQGRYADAIATGNRLIGNGDLTSSELVTINRELGTAYVALGSDELARAAFSALLAQQPDAEFDSVRTSPKVLHALEEARKVLAAVAAAKAADAKDAKLRPSGKESKGGKQTKAVQSAETQNTAPSGTQAKSAAEPSGKH